MICEQESSSLLIGKYISLCALFLSLFIFVLNLNFSFIEGKLCLTMILLLYVIVCLLCMYDCKNTSFNYISNYITDFWYYRMLALTVNEVTV